MESTTGDMLTVQNEEKRALDNVGMIRLDDTTLTRELEGNEECKAEETSSDDDGRIGTVCVDEVEKEIGEIVEEKEACKDDIDSIVVGKGGEKDGVPVFLPWLCALLFWRLGTGLSE